MSRLLGYFSILVNLLLGLFCLGLGLVGKLSGHAEMDISLLPVDPESVATVLICSGLVALLAVYLAFGQKRGPRSLLMLWSLVVAGVLIAALFRGSHQIDGLDGLRTHGVYVLVAIISLIGSQLHYRRARRRGAYYQRA